MTLMTNNDNYDTTMQEQTFTVEDYEQELNYFQEYDQDMLDSIEEEEYRVDESLLKLIVDVQSYLADAPTDSPLFSLQYKMYTYLKQRALELGMDIPTL